MKINSSRGHTLIELAVTLVVLGFVILIGLHFGISASQRSLEIQALPALSAADQAIIGFAAANNRLPCPDTDGDGNEDCAGGVSTGNLPLITLGLARTDLANVRYGVFRSAKADARQDADLAAYPAKDRLAPLIASGYPAAILVPPVLLGQTNGIDLCEGLRLGNAMAADNTKLHIRNASGAMLRNVAYALALPGKRDADGDGKLFDGANVIANAFAAPSQPVSANYDDVVMAIDFGQMFSRLSCAGILSAVSHAHANAASAAAIVYSGYMDYGIQLKLNDDMADAKIDTAKAGTFSAAAGVADAAASTAIALSITFLTEGAASALIVAGAVAVAFNAAAVISAGLALGQATNGKQITAQQIADFAPKIVNAQILSTSIHANALNADSRGLYQ